MERDPTPNSNEPAHERRNTNPSLERDRLTTPPSIYVASLADYNNGRLHGDWIDATQDVEDIRAAIAAMLRRSPALRAEGETFGDWAIHDYEGFGTLRLGELEDLDFIHAVATGIAEHGPAFAAWLEVRDDVAGEPDAYDQLSKRFADDYLGEYESLTAYGEQLIDDLGWREQAATVLPEAVMRFLEFDAEALAQDMWLGGEIHVASNPAGGVWLFRGE
jgi:antirestriction protein